MYSTLRKNFVKQPESYQPLVLIVDNDRDNLLFASCVIESMGMNYAATDDSEECLGLVYEIFPDIILLDVVMPKINGLEITRIIKQDQKISHIPIIAVTGLTKTEDKNKLIEGGFNDYICKPYLIEELEFKVYSCLKCPLV
ncbi:Response regulator containing a CheY-like receiver domain and a GGDEF domain [Hyella patelloides LEGE 07179]|uniref:Response regulator containing a CheY-like receiver domain and a GGDEF domain n=1 Tax=Hyella patelloides LEGE 07179 TaxID=945734 RepID=A0A563VR58_9CYAN|nr:response regulator [Hyella patelloides]VEP13891.1 Response regulator containing a CheY-like receiver domain and a GGDEF domain [Hyella patelloides LEGE 07179]